MYSVMDECEDRYYVNAVTTHRDTKSPADAKDNKEEVTQPNRKGLVAKQGQRSSSLLGE